MFVEFELPFDHSKLPAGPACAMPPEPRCEWWDFNTSAWSNLSREREREREREEREKREREREREN